MPILHFADGSAGGYGALGLIEGSEGHHVLSMRQLRKMRIISAQGGNQVPPLQN